MEEPVPVIAAVDGGTARLLPDVDRPRAYLLTVEGAPQSYVDLDDPTHLEFEYARRLAHVVDVGFPPGRPLDAVHLGGGALTLPRYVAATRPGSRQEVAESDRGVIALVAEHLPLPPDCGVALRAGDGGAALARRPPASCDLVIADVYGGARVPAHVASLEFVGADARAVRPHGLYVANLADSAPFRFLGSQLATAAAVFPELCLVAEPSVLRGRRFGNAVEVAAEPGADVGAAVALAELARRTAGDPFPARVEYGPALRRLTAGAQPVTDADAVPSPEPPDDAFTLD
ncbi:fused MFS/spermidine synthase [Streptomyces synnematoformans]|uniref:Fused MFS/spermidine synthase n=1 Tax=Streptomyces synnematoformans TaxID=415721 RepID=A0ABN2Z1B1_9ACTN